ncbi:hypothetical protein [Nostoc sp.]|uniref:hypothetical protein n=1 Tax=Nostoc sp. TaxID=1180 RepID=UPI002FF80B2D
MTQQPTDLDNKAVFEQLWEITKEPGNKFTAQMFGSQLTDKLVLIALGWRRRSPP